MAAITASMVGELRAQDRRADDGMQEGADRGRRRHGQGRRAAARQARQQGRQGRHRASRPKAWSPRTSTAAPARWSKSTAKPTSSPRTTTSWRSPRRCAELVAKNNPADVAALGALPLAGRLRPDGRRRAQGPDRQDRREHVDPPLQALRTGDKLASLPARHAHRRAGRVRRATTGRPRTSRCTSPR